MRINISWKYQSRNERTERGNEWKAEWTGRDEWQVIRLHNFFIINFANIRERLCLFKLIEKGCFGSRLAESFPFRCRLRSSCGSNGPDDNLFAPCPRPRRRIWIFINIYFCASFVRCFRRSDVTSEVFPRFTARLWPHTMRLAGGFAEICRNEKSFFSIIRSPAKLMAHHLSPIRRRRSSPSQQICFIKYSGFVFRRVRQKREAKRLFMFVP